MARDERSLTLLCEGLIKPTQLSLGPGFEVYHYAGAVGKVLMTRPLKSEHHVEMDTGVSPGTMNLSNLSNG